MLAAGGMDRSAAFHVQQAVEKIVKALLLLHGIPHRATSHFLVELIGALPHGQIFAAELTRFVKWERYATSFRYPTSAGRIKPVEEGHDIAAALQDLTALLAEVRDYCAEIDPA